MIWNMKEKIINNLYESELFEPSIARTAHKAAVLVERIVESKEPRKELKKWLQEQTSL
jgi:acyl CoA:acetate/3-ketoacid CoA transferase alpha subunit